MNTATKKPPKDIYDFLATKIGNAIADAFCEVTGLDKQELGEDFMHQANRVIDSLVEQNDSVIYWDDNGQLRLRSQDKEPPAEAEGSE